MYMVILFFQFFLILLTEFPMGINKYSDSKFLIISITFSHSQLICHIEKLVSPSYYEKKSPKQILLLTSVV